MLVFTKIIKYAVLPALLSIVIFAAESLLAADASPSASAAASPSASAAAQPHLRRRLQLGRIQPRQPITMAPVLI